LVVGDCPSGWIDHRDSCYFFSNHNRNWYDAGFTCEAIHSRRVTIDSNDENDFLAGTFTHFRGLVVGDCPSGWIGHRDSCYFFSNHNRNWYDAGGRFVRIRFGLKERQRGRPMVAINGPHHRTRSPTTIGVKNEPNATIGDCFILRLDRTWQSRDCHSDKGFVCES
ncbi:asialoglycoprotein receptor 1-like, partial [Mizuhopecten yessoensis]|uniref:asialoglycoprotein receptor 1-like n=1 Tax=Mizuhopecten yessoensis TaxID=6573 RepID=UPI000B45ECDA